MKHLCALIALDEAPLLLFDVRHGVFAPRVAFDVVSDRIVSEKPPIQLLQIIGMTVDALITFDELRLFLSHVWASFMSALLKLAGEGVHASLEVWTSKSRVGDSTGDPLTLKRELFGDPNILVATRFGHLGPEADDEANVSSTAK